ncbi:MAG: MBL fold metallo-hydrolase [Oscillospiraceae bacterium]|nr:MBL fold metallo-hydrolase [Oscillospiraceae bacterium]
MDKQLKKKLGSIITAIIFIIAVGIYVTKEYDHVFDFSPAPSPTVEGSCAVHFIDVGQGDSALISCGGVNILIDAGENNKGDEVLLKLKELNIECLDYVIGTHAHSDHIGGLDTVLNGVEVKNIILSDLPDKLIPNTKTYSDLLDAIVENEVNLIAAEVGASYKIGEGKLTLLAPVNNKYSDLNDWSIVARFEFGQTRFLFTGDAEEGAEEDILYGGADLAATLLKAGHHGSSTSSSQKFLDAVDPEIVVISVGEGNSYGHPNTEALTRFASIGAEVYRTDIDGDITAVSDGKTITITCENEG